MAITAIIMNTMASTPSFIPTIEDIRSAAQRIAPYVAVTPLLESPALNSAAGGRVLIKAEVLQHTGSFKLRGALSRLLLLTDDERKRGVVAYSSGNHAQAVAYGATLLGISSTIVMPEDAPELKIKRTRAFGAQVVLYNRYTDDRVAIGTQIAEQTGATIVPPFEDPYVVAGQGTLGLESLTQASERGVTPSRIFVNCGGGGLTAGCALAAQAIAPDCVVHPCEPVGFDDMARSLQLGHIVSNEKGHRSVCDAIITDAPGKLAFAISKDRVGKGLQVTDEEVLAAVAFAATELKLIVEPGGAASLAALLSHKLDTQNEVPEVTMVVLSGGNIDPVILARALGVAQA